MNALANLGTITLAALLANPPFPAPTPVVKNAEGIEHVAVSWDHSRFAVGSVNHGYYEEQIIRIYDLDGKLLRTLTVPFKRERLAVETALHAEIGAPAPRVRYQVQGGVPNGPWRPVPIGGSYQPRTPYEPVLVDESGKVVHRFPLGTTSSFGSMESPSAKLAAFKIGTQIAFLDTSGETPTVIHSFDTGEKWDHAGFLLNRDNPLAAVPSVNDGGKVNIWSLRTGTIVDTIPGLSWHRKYWHGSAVALSADGSKVALAEVWGNSESTSVSVYDRTRREWIYHSAAHKRSVNELFFSPDGKGLYGADWEGRILKHAIPQ